MNYKSFDFFHELLLLFSQIFQESLLIPKIAVDDINPLDFVKVKSEPQEEDNNENFPHFVVCNEPMKQEIKEELQG